MKTFIFISFLLITTSVFAGFSNHRSTSIEEIDGFLADLDERTSVKPSDTFQLYSERQWVGDELTKIRNLKKNYKKRGGTNLRNYDEVQETWGEFRSLLNSLKSDDLQGFNKLVKEKYERVFNDIQLYVFRNDLENLFAESGVDGIWANEPLSGLIDENEIVSASEANHQVIYPFMKSQLVPKVDSFFNLVKDNIKKKEQENSNIWAKLSTAEAKVLAYRNSLKDIVLKSETKDSLKSNLHLMILVIGGLSIGAIALVRWFPEPVMLEWVESGQVIQFVTVMILLSVIMALGLAGLLTENTLGTLLGGIGGYVLSQGVGRSAARAAIKEHEKVRETNKVD